VVRAYFNQQDRSDTDADGITVLKMTLLLHVIFYISFRIWKVLGCLINLIKQYF